jgi:UDPglucose 6-dehydrogenase
VLAAARSADRLMADYKVVVDNSTVPVGAADQVRQAIAEELSARDEPMNFAIVGNPELRKEGAAIDDFMGPGRIVVGSDD